MKTKTSVGSFGKHAVLFRWILCSNRHSIESEQQRELKFCSPDSCHIVRLTTFSLIKSLVACRFIALAKNSGVRPTACRRDSSEDLESRLLGTETRNQLLVAEAAIHRMTQPFKKEYTDAVLLIRR